MSKINDARKKKTPKDINKLATFIVEESTKEQQPNSPIPKSQPDRKS